MVDSSSIEDELNRLLDQISNIITTFNTLSREQAENAILEGTSKLKKCESILSQIEQDLDDNKNNHGPEELLEEKKNLKNYKNELNDLSNKFKAIQDSYINKKAQNALIDDEIKISSEENINEDNKNDNEGKSKEKLDNNISFNNKVQNGFENNIGNISDVKNSRNLPDDAFDNLNNKNKSKKKCLIIGVCIFFVVIFLFVVILGVQSNKK
jgi:hypothetical protein